MGKNKAEAICREEICQIKPEELKICEAQQGQLTLIREGRYAQS